MLRPPFIAIGVLSACVLAYEVLLTRLFSIALWHHFAYLIISAAMLGYGASGTFLTLFGERIAARAGAAYVAAAVALALLMPGAFMFAQELPFNPLELLWDRAQWPLLLAVYLLMMLPFFCGGLGIGLVFARCGGQAAPVYAVDIVGAGAGSLGAIALLYLVPPARALSLLAALALLGAAIAIVELRMRPRGVAGILLALALLVALAMPAIPLRPSPYKDLSQALNIAGARVVAQSSSPLGLVTVVENSRVPLRDAPGMSLNASSEPPPQLAVFVDGNGPSALTRFDGRLAPLAYLDELTSALPWHLRERQRVLVLGAGAGSDVLQALYHGSEEVDAVELDPALIDLVGRRFRDHAGDLYARPGVHVHAAEARGFVNASRKQYDLIQVALLDSFGTAAAGLYGLSENYLYTVEALQAYLAHLSADGVLAITRWLTLPPRDALKLFATAVAALERSGASEPGSRLAMIRGWKTVTLLVKKRAFSEHEITAIRDFGRTRSFDMAYLPGMRADEANRYNRLARPYFFDGTMALLGAQRQDFIDRYKFYIEPATDDRPHFFRFFKWGSAGELFALRAQGGASLLDWSYPLLVVTLLQAIAAGVLLLLLPLAFARCRRSFPGAPVALYFIAIGLAFMFIELAFIQKFVLFLAHPLHALAVVLCAFLVFAAVGSWLAGTSHVANKLPLAVAAIGVLSIVYLVALPPLFEVLIHLPDAAKMSIAVLLIAPLAICMGVPFPSAMARLSRTSEQAIPWAWAINGFASVVGAVLATLLAMHLGFAAVVLLAVLAYALALAAWRKFA